ATACGEEPTGEGGDQEQIIKRGRGPAWRGNVIVRSRPASEPIAADADQFHQSPTGVVEEFGGGGKPAGEKQAGEGADEYQGADWNRDQIGGRAHGSEDVKVISDQWQRTDPGSKRS